MTKQVRVGNVLVGGGAPVSIQSMCNTDTSDIDASLRQINKLYEAGCEIVRLTVPDEAAAKAFGKIKNKSPLPMVADIHFDYRMAIMAMDNGADKVRINPGNIGSVEKLRTVYEHAKSCGIPVRVGVNSGSLEKSLIEKYGSPCAEALAESALGCQKFAEECGFENTIISIKSTDVQTFVKANKILAASTDRPLHIGLTEAGVGRAAEIKSACSIGALLLDGIGDTIRVSLTGDPVREVVTAKQILCGIGLRKNGIDFVSCPTCGRTKVDLPVIAEKVEAALIPVSDRLASEGKFIRVAVMGCAVNGPGEARFADYGVACGLGEGLIFKKGEILKKVKENEIVNELLDCINNNI